MNIVVSALWELLTTPLLLLLFGVSLVPASFPVIFKLVRP